MKRNRGTVLGSVRARGWICLGFCISFVWFAARLDAQDQKAVITLKDGSKVVGEIVGMEDGELKVSTAFGGEVPIKWSEVKALVSQLSLKVVTKDNVLSGPVTSTTNDAINVRIEGQNVPIPIAKIKSINPVEKPAITYTGNLSFGASVSDGNTRNRTAAATGEFVTRSDRQRMTLRGAWNYAEDEDGLTARNTKGSIKYDFFLTKRWYLYAGSLFEGDKFQDLNLRTALSGGLGYQFLNKGELESEYLKGLEGYAEIGVAYFDEDFKEAMDEQYVSGRWSVKVDWDFVPGRVALFHFHEGYPGFENLKDLYITTEQGVRFSIWEGFIATLQVNWRWDNTPSAGFDRSDTLYLATLGYGFNF